MLTHLPECDGCQKPVNAKEGSYFTLKRERPISAYIPMAFPTEYTIWGDKHFCNFNCLEDYLKERLASLEAVDAMRKKREQEQGDSKEPA